MEREIEGYVLKDNKYLYVAKQVAGLKPNEETWSKGEIVIEPHTQRYETFKEFDLLDVWFKPVYKEETFKKGEWVVITDFGSTCHSNFSNGKAYELEKDLNEKNGFITVIDDKGHHNNGWSNSFDLDMKFRKATNLEIAKAKYPKGTRFYSSFSGYLCVSTGEFKLSEEYNIVTDGMFVLNEGKWAEIITANTLEVTLDEIAKKFNVDVNNLKIKK